jgi:hypothetical protein
MQQVGLARSELGNQEMALIPVWSAAMPVRLSFVAD